MSKLHERLYQEKKQKEKLLKEKKAFYEQESLKECTFTPVVNNNIKFLKRKQARSPNPSDARMHMQN